MKSEAPAFAITSSVAVFRLAKCALAGCGTAPDEDTKLKASRSSSDEDSGSPEGSNPEPPAACTVLEDGTCSGGKERCCQIEGSRFDFEARCWRPAGPSRNANHAAVAWGTLTCVPIAEGSDGCREYGATVCIARMLPDGELEVVRTSAAWLGEDWLPCEAPAWADFELNDLPSYDSGRDVCP